MGTRKLPCHQHGQTQLSLLNDENVMHTIKEALIERAKSGFLEATDIMEVVSSLGVQDQLSEAGINRPSITKSTACHWLGRLGWRHGRHQNGMLLRAPGCRVRLGPSRGGSSCMERSVRLPGKIGLVTVSSRQRRRLGCERGHLVKRHTRVAKGW